MKKFSKWYKFNDLFEYKGLASDNSEWDKITGYFIKVDGELRQFNTDNGFNLTKEAENLINKTSKGLYFLKIFTPKLGTKVYIGKSEGKSIKSKSGVIKRLFDHFQKIQSLPMRGDNPENKSLYKELAFHKSFGGMGYKLQWNDEKTKLLDQKKKLVTEDRKPGVPITNHGIVLGEFKDIKSVSNDFIKLSSKEKNKKWKNFNKKIKEMHHAELYKKEFWDSYCEFSILLVDDLFKTYSEKEIDKLIKVDIDKAETKAIQALRKNFDADDILNHQKMEDPKKIHDIDEKLLHESFDLNSVDTACEKLILNNAKDILDKLQPANLKKCFESALENISASNQDYYLRLTLTGNSDLRISPTQQRKKAKNFMVFDPTRKYINCKCSLSCDELNNFFKNNNCQDFVSDINETPNESSNIRSSFKITYLDNSSWINDLMDECFKCFDKKYPQKRIKENRTPRYGEKKNGMT